MGSMSSCANEFIKISDAWQTAGTAASKAGKAAWKHKVPLGALAAGYVGHQGVKDWSLGRQVRKQQEEMRRRG